MAKVIKWAAIISVVLVVVIGIAVILAPMLINIEKYKPQIEAEASKIVGRPVTLGGKIQPSVFPWVGIALSDVHLGNPPGFKEKDFVSVGAFEVRIKLLPLLTSLFTEIEVKRFVLNNTNIVIEKNKQGQSNLEGLGASSTPAKKPATPARPTPADTAGGASGLPIKSFEAKEFAITNARVLILDDATGSRHEIKDLNLVLTDFSFNNPIGVQFSALADGKPLSLTGTVGPVGPDPGKSPVAVALVAELLKQVKVEIKGRVDHPMESPAMELQLQIPAFSVRKVMAAIDQPLPMTPSDPEALNSVALAMKITGTPENVTVTDGRLTLDGSKMTFQAKAGEFDKPNISLKADLDQIDVDRYLPPPAEKTEQSVPESPAASPAPEQKKKTDYTPLRKLVLDARIKVGALKVKNVHMQNIVTKITAKSGVFRLDPLDVDLYKGKIATTGTFDVQKDQPRSTFKLSVSSVQVGPLLKDFLNKEILEGAASSGINLQFEGDQPDMIRKTLDGKGELVFADGAIVGIDLANMIRNIESAFGLAEKSAEKPRTDFTELIAPFSIDKGIFQLDDARLSSPLLRLTAGGTANLVQETIDMRIEPKFVATLVGQGDSKQRSGVMVPIMVSGTFAKPKFKPDLKSILTQQLPDKETLEKMVPKKEEIQKDIEKKAQELFKGLPFGKPKE